MIKTILTNHKGTGHKLAHNVTTLANIPLVIWLVSGVLTLKNADHSGFVSWLSEPFNAAMAVLFVLFTLSHFTLELEVVFEDYIADIKRRKMVIKFMKLFWLALGAISIISILRIAL
ncbi:MAG: succinate dehydrogenase, hydrophobic membrane anchor protein [Pseudomonadota bacterium]